MLITRLFFVLVICFWGLNGCVPAGAWLQDYNDSGRRGRARINKQVIEAKEKAKREAWEHGNNSSQAWDAIFKDYRNKKHNEKAEKEAEKLRAAGKKATVLYENGRATGIQVEEQIDKKETPK